MAGFQLWLDTRLEAARFNERLGPATRQDLNDARMRAFLAGFGGVFVNYRRKDAHQPVVVIHPNWHNDLSKWVRFEIATALRTGKKVIPVLPDGATLPLPEKLPNDIGAIALRQARWLRQEPSDQYDDLDRLVTAVQQAAGMGRL